MFGVFTIPSTQNWAGLLVWFLGLFLAIPFVRYVIGIRHWRNSTVVMLGVSLWLFLTLFRRWYLGAIVWSYLFFAGLAFGLAMYQYLRLKPIHYFVKVAIIVLGIFTGIYVGLWGIYSVLGVVLLQNADVTLAIVLMLAVVYEYVVLYGRKGFFEFVRRGVATGVLGVLWGVTPYYEVVLEWIYRYHVVAIVLMAAVLIFVLARWNYLTIAEFFRFRPILESKRE